MAVRESSWCVGQVATRRLVRRRDAACDLRKVAITQIGQLLVARWYHVAAGHHVDGHPVGQGGHVPGEPMPAGDLERDQADLPGSAWRREGALDAAHLEHVHRRGAELDRTPNRN